MHLIMYMNSMQRLIHTQSGIINLRLTVTMQYALISKLLL